MAEPRKEVTELVTGLAYVLRRERVAAGLTQEELAERSGVSARTISDAERGLRSVIYKDTAVRLAAALGLDIAGRDEFIAIARGRSTGSARTIPVSATGPIGRGVEIQAAIAASRQSRLVTLTGPGGIGKTRIAVEVARAVRDAVFVPLGSLDDPSFVPSVVAHAVDAVSTATSPIDAIASKIVDRSVLFVLDTFEHLMDGAPFVTELLERCPKVHVLVTSRERLHLTGEREVEVSPLDASDAAQLFLERATAAGLGSVPDAEAVTEICRRLEGLPLAIELAAARLRHMTLASLLEHLDDRLALLVGGPNDVPSRQRTIRDTVAWSFDLLDDDARRALAALSVFAGGWTLDAAEAVVQSDEPLAPLSALVDKSLITFGDDGRYRMLDVIREFAAEHRGDSAERAHAEFFAAYAESAEPMFGSAGQEQWFEFVEHEHDNIRAALRFAVDERDAALAQRMAGALWQFWRANGHVQEGRAWLNDALTIPSEDAFRAKALWGAAWLAYHQDDYPTAERLSIELLAFARRTSAPMDLRNGLTIRGMIAMAEARYAEAAVSFEEALELCRPLGRSWLLATSHLNLGSALMHVGDLERAQEMFGSAAALYRELGDRRFATRGDMYLAQVRMLRGDDDGACESAALVLSAAADIGDEQSIAEGLETLAAAEAFGRPDRAAFVAGVARAMRDDMSIRQLPYDRALVDGRLTTGRARISEREWRDAFDEGRTTALDAAIEQLCR